MGLSQVPAARAGATRNIQAFTSSTTWTVPSTAIYVDVLVVGGGSGGGGGRRSTENASLNAGMGGAMVYVSDIFLNGTGTVAITVGSGSAGTTGTASTTYPATPGQAGFSAFGTFAYAGGAWANTPGIPTYRGGVETQLGNFTYRYQDSNGANYAPLWGYRANMFHFIHGVNRPAGAIYGLNLVGLEGGHAGRSFQASGSGNHTYAGGYPGMGSSEDYATPLLNYNLPNPALPSNFYTFAGSGAAGTAGTGGAAGGAGGIAGFSGGGGAPIYGAGQGAGVGGPGAGGGGTWPNPVGGTGGNGGNAGANTGAGGGVGANSGSTTAGTGGNGGNGGSGIVIVSWIS